MCFLTDTPEEFAERMSIIFESQMRFTMMMIEFNISQEKMKMEADRKEKNERMKRHREELDCILADRKINL